MTTLDSPDLFSAALVAPDPALLAYQAAETRPVVTPIGSSEQALCGLARSGRNGFSPVTRFDTGWCESGLACAFPASDDASRKARGAAASGWTVRCGTCGMRWIRRRFLRASI